MEQPLISIIVPVYNVQPYLECCLSSLAEQTYTNVEIILVNDGSTDQSAHICRRTCDEDKRFRLIEQENQGLGPARNAGISIATGEYVCFVDSDDYVDKQYVEVMYNSLMEHNADMVMCSYTKFVDGCDSEADRVKQSNRIVVDLKKEEMISDLATVGPHNRSERIVVSWNKLMKRELWQNLRFPSKYHEDEYVILDLILQSDRVVWNDAPLYFYRQRAGSIMERGGARHLDLLPAIEGRMKKLEKNGFSHLLADTLIAYFENAIYLFYSLRDQLGKREIRKAVCSGYFRMWLHFGRKLSWKKRLRYLAFLLLPKTYKKRYIG